jgi:hypothetical protein
MGEWVDLEDLLKINPCLITACFESISGIDFHGCRQLGSGGRRLKQPVAGSVAQMFAWTAARGKRLSPIDV